MKKLCLMLTAALLLLLCACTSEKQADLQPEPPDISESAVSWDGLTFDRELPLSYATQFSVSYAGDDYTRITIGTDQDFLLVAENAEIPEGVPASVTVLHRPLSHIYLVASAAMDYFDHLDAVDRISLSGLKTGDWYIESAKAAMEAGSMRYAGKYSAPDYEAILESGCDLAIENTMIYHTPEVIEQLQTTGVPVLVERSSYESSPLGRIEWLKLFGALENNELTIAAGKYMEECFNKGDCEAVFREDVLPFIWKKVIVNCTVNTVCAVTRLKIGYVENNPYGKKLFHNVIRECCAVAEYKGVHIDPDEFIRVDHQHIIDNISDYYPSMAQDMLYKKLRTEVDTLTGTISDYGKQFNVPTPTCDVLSDLVRCSQDNYANQYGEKNGAVNA